MSECTIQSTVRSKPPRQICTHLRLFCSPPPCESGVFGYSCYSYSEWNLCIHVSSMTISIRSGLHYWTNWDVGVIVWHALLCKWVCKHMSIMTVKNKTTSPNESVFHTSGLLWGYFTGNWCVDSRHRWRLFFVFLFRSQSNGWTNYQVSDYLKPQVDHVASQKWYGIIRFLSLIMWIYDIFSKKAWWAIRHSFAYHCIYLWNMQNMCHAVILIPDALSGFMKLRLTE